jgi:hypothetical protein
MKTAGFAYDTRSWQPWCWRSWRWSAFTLAKLVWRRIGAAWDAAEAVPAEGARRMTAAASPDGATRQRRSAGA